MAFHNVPPNGFPDLPDVEELEAVVKDVTTLKTTTAEQGAAITNLGSTKANQITIAPFFNPETAYEAGDLVYYNGLSYRCTNDHEGAWDAADFAATTIAGEIASVKSGLTNLNTITEESVGNIHFDKAGKVVMTTMVNGTISTDAEGFVMVDDARASIPAAYRPKYSVNIVESYAEKRLVIGSDGSINMPNELSVTGLVIRFETAYLTN